MADDLTNRGEQDRSRIKMSEKHEVRYWTEVEQVGNSVEAVRNRLTQPN